MTTSLAKSVQETSGKVENGLKALLAEVRMELNTREEHSSSLNTP